MKKRCGRCMDVDGSRNICGLRTGHPWPHRYIEKKFLDRLRHETNLFKYGYTTRWQWFAAVFLRRGYPVK